MRGPPQIPTLMGVSLFEGCINDEPYVRDHTTTPNKLSRNLSAVDFLTSLFKIIVSHSIHLVIYENINEAWNIMRTFNWLPTGQLIKLIVFSAHQVSELRK